MSYVQYTEINRLEEVSFIAGSDYTFVFTAYEENGVTPLDLSGATIHWVLSPYGQPDYKVLQVEGSITGANVFKVVLLSAATREFSGKYIHQPVIISFSGKEYRPAQGLITIVPRTPFA